MALIIFLLYWADLDFHYDVDRSSERWTCLVTGLRLRALGHSPFFPRKCGFSILTGNHPNQGKLQFLSCLLFAWWSQCQFCFQGLYYAIWVFPAHSPHKRQSGIHNGSYIERLVLELVICVQSLSHIHSLGLTLRLMLVHTQNQCPIIWGLF